MIVNLSLLLLGFILLVKGADVFVEKISKIAKRLGVSDLIIGLTFTAIGTSIPELASSITASIEGYPGIIMGNVIGSNIANIGLIIGISAIIASFRTNKRMYLRDGYIFLLSVILFFFFSQDNIISVFEGAILLSIYGVYILFIMRTKNLRIQKYKFHDFLEFFFDFQYIKSVRSRILKRAFKKTPRRRSIKDKREIRIFTFDLFTDIMLVFASILAIVFGARFLIDEAVWLAHMFNIPNSLIGLSIIAIGTSLPELSVSISAAIKGRGDMIIGNILGSNIANIFLISGVSSLIAPLPVSEIDIIYLIPIMGFFSVAVAYFIKSNWQIGRRQGILLLFSYLVFLVFSFYMGLT